MSHDNDLKDWQEGDYANARLLDVRPLLEAGREPFHAIMEAVEKLEPGQSLLLRAPFEPVPLYGVMGSRGFARKARPVTGEAGEDFWEVLFYPRAGSTNTERKEDDDQEDPDGKEDGALAEIPADDGPRELDVRGLEPPEPMERVLATIDGLRYDDVLLVRHHREPLFLYPILSDRGFSHRAEWKGESECLVRIWRNR